MKAIITATELHEQGISTNTRAQINQSIFVSYQMHAMSYMYFASLRLFTHQGCITPR